MIDDVGDEFIFGQFTNLSYYLGRLDSDWDGPITQVQLAQIVGGLSAVAEWAEHYGLLTTLEAVKNLIEILGTHEIDNSTHDHVTLVRQCFMTDLKTRMFLPVEPRDARYYREPRRDWEEVTERFPEAVLDIEEAGKCYALHRYAAAVYHCIQVQEHGLLALGQFIGVNDPKSGFTAVANSLHRITTRKRDDLSDLERTHYAFLEQMDASVQAIKNAWRNKVSHAQGRPTLMTADFSPAIAEEIYIATRAFMRRLATELPS